jgi:hypothetical protein
LPTAGKGKFGAKDCVGSRARNRRAHRGLGYTRGPLQGPYGFSRAAHRNRKRATHAPRWRPCGRSFFSASRCLLAFLPSCLLALLTCCRHAALWSHRVPLVNLASHSRQSLSSFTRARPSHSSSIPPRGFYTHAAQLPRFLSP